MNKPAFDPNQPFASAKPAFDPNAPFTAESAEPMPETGLQKLAGGISNVMQNIDNPGRMMGNQPPQVNTMAPQGDNLFNRAGEAVTDALGQSKPFRGSPVVPAMAGTAVSMMNPQNWLTPEMPGKTALPGQEMAQEAAQNAGRKALGYTKLYLNKKPGNLGKANAVAQTMLDEGVITNPITHPLSSGTESMIERNDALGQSAGQGIGQAIDTLSGTGKRSFSGADVNREIESQLTPKYEGGAYDAERGVVKEIMDTVKAHGEGPLDFKSAQDLKEKLQELGKFNTNTDAVKANLYRRASGIVREALDSSVGAASAENPGLPGVPEYMENKNLYGKSMQAEKALRNRLSSEQGNKNIGLTDTIVAGAELAAGNPVKAAVTLGAKRALERGYHAGKASMADAFAKETLGPLQKRGLVNTGLNADDDTRRNAYASFISRITTKDNP